jgi:SAM-dependent methyltransferase
MTSQSTAADDPPFDTATLRFYTDEAPAYAASGPPGASRHLARFLDRLEPGARILELGCGGGRDALAMIERGFTVEATDGCPELAREAEARIGQPVRVMRFDELDAVEAYHGIWAHASLLHVPREALPGVLGRIHRALSPGGLHFASFKGGGAEGRDRFGRYFNYLDAAELLAIYRAAAPWKIVAIEEHTSSGYDGVQGPWTLIGVRKSA